MRTKPFCLLVVFLVAATISTRSSTPSEQQKQPSLLDIYEVLKTKRFVDLTHAFGPGIPHWPGFPDEKRETLYHYDEGIGSLGAGFLAHRYTIVGQWGTHVDPPAHFARGLRTVDEIDCREMLLPLVVLDVHQQAEKNPDYILTMKDVEAWEKKHGPVPEGAFVAMRTDWSKRWPDPAKMRNEDDKKVAHYPGWSMEVLKYLYETRKIVASGHETTDTDPGRAASKGDFSLETYILKTNHYQIELLANLDQVPEFQGAMVVVTFAKPKKGSGVPRASFCDIAVKLALAQRLEIEVQATSSQERLDDQASDYRRP